MMSLVLRKLSRQPRKEFLLPFIATFLMAGFLPNFAHAQAAGPQLHDKVIVKGKLVTLADLFTHAGLKGDTPLFRSPNPGTTGKISVQRILSAAKKHGLDVLRRPSFSMVTISRSSRKIELEVLKDLIRENLKQKQPVNDTKSQLVLHIPNEKKEFHLDVALQGKLTLSSLDWSTRTRRFIARFAVPDSEPLVLKGTATLMVEVGVARGAIAKGQTLNRSDIELKLVKTSGRRKVEPVAIEEMVGLSAKRSMQAGKQIKLSDLEAPLLIQKNQLVTILLEVPGLIIRAEGKALADASKGEAVKVLNTQSKRIIHATAEASGLVSVSMAQTLGSGS